MANSNANAQGNNSKSRQSNMLDIFAETWNDKETVNITEEMFILQNGTTVDLSGRNGIKDKGSISTNLYSNMNLESDALNTCQRNPVIKEEEIGSIVVEEKFDIDCEKTLLFPSHHMRSEIITPDLKREPNFENKILTEKENENGLVHQKEVNDFSEKGKIFIKKEINDSDNDFVSDKTETSNGFKKNKNCSLKKREVLIKKEASDLNHDIRNNKTETANGFHSNDGAFKKGKVFIKKEISDYNNSLINDKAKAENGSNNTDFLKKEIEENGSNNTDFVKKEIEENGSNNTDFVKKEIEENGENRSSEDTNIISDSDDSFDEVMNVSEEDVHSSDIEEMFSTKKRKKSKKENSEPLECSTCGKTFKLEHNLQKHVLSHIHDGLQPVRKFKCEICGKNFKKKHHLQRHNLAHTQTKEFACAHCEKCYKDKYDLKKHLSSKHTVRNCSYCGMTFENYLELRKHQVIHKTSENKNTFSVSCQICQKTFLKDKYLKRHLKIHAKITPFACTQCSKSFLNPFLLKEHVRTHTGEKPFQCDKCGRKFSTKSNQVRHLRTHFKTKTCYNCCAEFEDEEQFKAHKASCTLSYECGKCGWICGRLSNIRRHVKTHTKYSNPDAEDDDDSTVDSKDFFVRVV